jgi:hypothetical protein
VHGASVNGHEITLVLDLDELRLVNNALNEILHGVGMADAELTTRLGGSRERAKRLLAELHSVICAAEEYGGGRPTPGT